MVFDLTATPFCKMRRLSARFLAHLWWCQRSLVQGRCCHLKGWMTPPRAVRESFPSQSARSCVQHSCVIEGARRLSMLRLNPEVHIVFLLLSPVDSSELASVSYPYLMTRWFISVWSGGLHERVSLWPVSESRRYLQADGWPVFRSAPAAS